ncbi:hypothetical protein OEZ86_001645 [Tetradesmus obliquus]|nr:hypothetical protein OEZ86_001645 [Tetradesmus obliquus]
MLLLLQSLPFLKAAQPDALKPLLANGFTTIDMAAVQTFATKTLVPMIGANVVFLALAMLFLVIFIPCCDAKRAARNPYKLLFNKGTKVLKGFMLLFGLVAVAFAIYGMATVKKDVTDDAFGVITTISNYTTGVTDTVDRLMDTIGGVSGIIDDFQAIIINDLDINGMMANLTAVGVFLDAADPATLRTSITALQTAYDTTFKNRLAALRAAITVFGNDKTAMIASCGTLKAAPADLGVMKTAVDQVQTSLAGVTWTSAVLPSQASMQAVETAVNTVSGSTGAWGVTITSISTAITDMASLQTTATNPFTKLQKTVSNVKLSVTDVQSRIATLNTKVTQLTTDFAGVQPVMQGLLSKLQQVNTTVIALTASMEGAYSNLAAANTNMVTVFNSAPSLTSVTGDLATFSAGMPTIIPLNNLETVLLAGESVLNSAPYTSAGTAYKNWLTGLSGHITALASTPLIDFAAAVTTYAAGGGQTGPNWNALRSGVVGNKYDPFIAALDVIWVPTAGDFASSVFTSTAGTFNTQSASVEAAGAAVTPALLLAADNYAVAAAGQTLPSVTALTTNLDTLVTAFTPFGTPYSTVVNVPKAQLATIQDAVLTQGDAVKGQINGTISGARSGVANLKGQVVGQLSNVEDTYKPLVRQVDGYRYTVSMALYGVSILFVLLLLLCALLNYHFGANFSTLWLLLVSVLYFLLALLIAVLVSVLYLGCGQVEPLLSDLAPPAYAPLVNYYFNGQGDSIKAVLKSASIVDVDGLMGQVTAGQQEVLQGMAGNFTFRAGPLAVIGRVNSTIASVGADVDVLLGKASREQLLPVYSEVKGLVCCMVPDIFASMWTGLTFAGVFAFALIVCAFFFIGKIDHAPRKDCCGCTCHTIGKYEGTVFPDSLPQYNQPFDNPLGPYNAPMPGAGWSDGSEVAAHVVLAAPGGTAAVKKGDYY